MTLVTARRGDRSGLLAPSLEDAQLPCHPAAGFAPLSRSFITDGLSTAVAFAHKNSNFRLQAR